MKKAGIFVLSLIGGLIGGFVLYEMIVRISLQLLNQVPIVFIAILSAVMPLAGAVTTVILTRRHWSGQRP
ncbi:DUF5957 family protein [Paenibacillus harenae]|uniref:DUF5957 family protein n=1 Tax=Paenibacillus harenae TaxID=306543 RepID=UPI0004280A50|nr:DUF5957 family protein [Paenibacillus harenae]